MCNKGQVPRAGRTDSGRGGKPRKGWREGEGGGEEEIEDGGEEMEGGRGSEKRGGRLGEEEEELVLAGVEKEPRGGSRAMCRGEGRGGEMESGVRRSNEEGGGGEEDASEREPSFFIVDQPCHTSLHGLEIVWSMRAKEEREGGGGGGSAATQSDGGFGGRQHCFRLPQRSHAAGAARHKGRAAADLHQPEAARGGRSRPCPTLPSPTAPLQPSR